MSVVLRMLIAAALAFGSGCAQTDWIDRTLVTVDVTGAWYGSPGGGPGAYVTPDLLFELEQQGSTVKESVRFTPGGHGKLEGTLAGDVFHFRVFETSGNIRGVEGEVTVSGDEMSGRISTSTLGPRPVSLRRASPPSQLGQPTR